MSQFPSVATKRKTKWALRWLCIFWFGDRGGDTTYDGGGSISCTLHLLYYGIFARAMRTYRKLILSLVPRGLNIGT